MKPAKDYWKGAPKIDRLNIKIVEAASYAGLKLGDDVTQNTMSAIPMEDCRSIGAAPETGARCMATSDNQSVVSIQDHKQCWTP